MGTIDAVGEETFAPPGLGEWTGFQLFKAGWWIEHRIEAELEPLGLRGRHVMVLEMLAATTLSQQQMAAIMSLDATLLGMIVDDLDTRGLVTRTRDPADRRRYAVSLTPAGREAHRRARAAIDVAEAEVFAELDADDKAALAGILARMMSPYWRAKLGR